MGKTVLITGITGQDGSYLAELLLSKKYEVHGLIRRTSHFNRQNIDHIADQLHLHYGDMTDTGSILHIVKEVQPEEIYHLAGQSHVQISSNIPDNTMDVNGQGAWRLLEAVRLSDLNPCIYNAATSELFGGTATTHESLDESSEFHPRSPYAISKLMAYWFMRHYRYAYGMRTWNGILFNHESPRRGENFVTRKITLSIARIMKGQQKELVLGNLDARRDWGYAPDYVEAMHLMLQSRLPDDFVVATGEMHSIQEFLDLAMLHGGRVPVRVSDEYKRMDEVQYLCGDATKIRVNLGWRPKTSFVELVKIMMEADMHGTH